VKKILNIKTSTWLKTTTYEILIISHIPREIINTPIFEIVPYPDANRNILTEIIHDKYFIQNNKVYSEKTQDLVMNKCITGILNQDTTECRYSKTHKSFETKYVEPNVLLTWNLPKTILNENCISREITIESINIIKALNCSIQLEDILITSTILDYTQTIYVNNNVTKLEPLSYIQAKEIVQQQTKHYNIFQVITLTTLIIIVIILVLYFSYKYKSIPRKIIVKYKKQTETIPQSNNVQLNPISNETANIVLEPEPTLYPIITA